MRALATVLFWASLLHAAYGDEQQRTHQLTIFHTNDLEGQLLPRSGEGAMPNGFAHLLALLERERVAHASALILDGGDALGASSLARFDSGALVAQLMARAGYDAMVAGNHEFDYGLDTLRARARQLPFPLLAANVQTTTNNPLQPWTLIERDGLRIAIVGLLSPATAKLINPLHNSGLQVGDPRAALDALLPALRDSADYTIALLHMEEEEAVALAQRFPDIDLCITGGFRRANSQASSLHQVKLAGGGRLLSTPAGATHVGKIVLQWVRRDTLLVETSFAAQLLPIDGSSGPHPEASAAIADLQQRFAQSGRAVAGSVTERVDDAPAWIAVLMRRSARSEVSVINRGAISAFALEDSITVGEVRRLVRYDDFVVALDLSGKQLVELGAQSKARNKESQRLVFAGYDPAAETVNGRKLIPDEQYRVSTTAYLAEGGDAYLKPHELVYASGVHPTLKEIIIEHLAQPSEGQWERIVRIWKSTFKLNGALSWTGIGDGVAAYQDVSFLSGRSALAWNGLFDGRLSSEVPSGRLEHQVRSNYGQVRSNGRFRESSDRLQMDMTYTRQTRSPAPFAALAANSVWTAQKGHARPLTLRASAGLQRPLGQRGNVRIGLGWERDVAAGESDLGVELLPEYKAQWKGNGFSSSCKLFVGASKARTLSLQQYNSLTVRLGSDLHLSIDANFFAHRSSAVGSTGLKSELQFGLGYARKDKWF